jgi:2'-5' RNA ligase
MVAGLRAVCPRARWVRIEGVHVTLKFIGETPSERLREIKAALSSMPLHASFPVKFRGLGFFPNARRPRVLWAGVEAGRQLAELAAAADASLQALGIAGESRAYSPHLTLARFDDTRGLGALHAAVEKVGSPEFGAATATEFHLYQSVLKPGGAEYTRQATFPLSGRASE